jgi:uracil-DNA glycosylase
VDARARLQRYLEQRRELGETDLVLDRLDVEDVLRVLGAGPPGSTARADAPSQARVTGPPASTGEPPPDTTPRHAGGTGESQRTETAGPNAERSEPEPSRLRRPEERGDAALDWRETLRATGGAPAETGARSANPTARDDAMAKERRTASPKVTGDRARDAATAKRGSERGGQSDEGMDASPAPGAAAPDAGRPGRPSASDRRVAAAIAKLGVPEGLSVGAAAGELFGGPFSNLETLDEIASVVAKCKRCPLYATALNPVPGEGNPDADLVCVGEAPGANEDETGRPFVGAAGQLLTKILGAIKLAREDVFIANVLKHRPPNNRNPKPDEVEACSPYLVRQLELIRPKVIVAFGTFAAQTLLDTKLSIGKLRGQVHRYYGIPLVVTYHPAALLRNPAWKRPTWEDVQLARRILDRLTAA